MPEDINRLSYVRVHHLTGEIKFGNLMDGVKNITLTIDGVSNETAQFVWEL